MQSFCRPKNVVFVSIRNRFLLALAPETDLFLFREQNPFGNPSLLYGVHWLLLLLEERRGDLLGACAAVSGRRSPLPEEEVIALPPATLHSLETFGYFLPPSADTLMSCVSSPCGCLSVFQLSSVSRRGVSVVSYATQIHPLTRTNQQPSYNINTLLGPFKVSLEKTVIISTFSILS